MSSAAQYWIGPTIGEGAFGHVVYAVHKATERQVAIKVMDVSASLHATREQRRHQQNQTKQKTEMILNERKILSLPELKASKWIVDLWAAFCDPDSSASRCLYFVMELATGGDLACLIHRGLNSPDRLSWLQFSVPHYGCQLMEAVDFLHSKGILHCDLKPENMLLDASTGRLRLADFGCSIDTKEPRRSLFLRGTARYASPEVLRAVSPSALTFAVDYWSVGCVLHAMIYGHSPFDRGSEFLTVQAVLEYAADCECGQNKSSNCAAGKQCDPAERVASDEGEAHRSLYQKDEDCTIEKNKTTNATSTMPLIGKSAEKKELEYHDQLSLLSQSLLAVVSSDRISAWKSIALPFLARKLLDNGNREDGDSDQYLQKDEQSFASACDSKRILLPIPDWQDEVANAVLRDGSLGWSVFQL